jgi:subtilisin-like proprotein convertase family protein
MSTRRPFIWILACLLCLAGAWFFWQHSANTRTKLAALPAAAPAAKPAVTVPQVLTAVATNGAASVKTNQFAYRLSNTSKTLKQLAGDRHAILLENALIDTSQPLNLAIPKNLRSQDDPGAYIVQARGPIDNAFRAMLAAAGAQIVSYIPNDAYLVLAPADAANELAGNPLTQAVIPYEPYYKLQPSLLGLAVEQQALPPGTALNLGLFAANAGATEQQLEALGAKIIGSDQSPFGPVLRVLAPADWTVLAQAPGVQRLEPAHSRVTANDLSRVTLGVAADPQVATDYLNLYGSNVLVAVNDSGIDATHLDFKTGGSPPGRVFGLTAGDLADTNGHGTHVAGIIAGDGTESITVTNASGSIMPAANGQFRGKAPLATLFSINENHSDYVLQTNAALVGAPISNNSWDYGNGDAEYDLAAASYDAATRDALPGVTGSQPVLFVFAAGNSGGGYDNGTGGNDDTILSPGTAKNVITVGALEQLRGITNLVTIITPGTGTNAPTTNSTEWWWTQTDSGSQVAAYSSRGNVGVGTEGTYGRFKPDVVAPGNFVVSTRSSMWDTNAYYNPTNVAWTVYTFQMVATNALAYYNVSVPPNAVSVVITISSNEFSSPFPTNLPIYVQQSGYPDPVHAPGIIDFITSNNMVSIPPDNGKAIAGIQSIQNNGFDFAVGNSTNAPVSYDLSVAISTTNNMGDYYQVLEGMNDSLGTNGPNGPYYRYETGTSMAAAGVSGVLALLEDYFTNQLQFTPSPALLKAMLINGSRGISGYTIALTNGVNYQGWGLPSLPNTLPPGITNQLNAACSTYSIDQSPTNALATGDSHTYTVTINTSDYAQYYQLQATLVWTDPPGDPAAAIKLVNSLELVITNLDPGDVNYGSVYYGNDISPNLGYNLPGDTNSPNLDTINNVQNIILWPPLGGRYSVTVVGRAVNVNAVTAQTNNVVQDYALVMAVGEGEVTDALTVTDNGIVSNPTSDQQVTFVISTNSPLMNQFAGANTPLLGTNTLPLGTNTMWGSDGQMTIGMTNQWHFYVVTNTGLTADVTNAAFITFDPSTLSIPRMGVYVDTVANATRPEADIDLYATTDPSLTNLNPVAVLNCLAGVGDGRASLGRGGTEFVYYTNSTPGEVYYVGVKSEDQMGSEYGFMPVFTSTPFSQVNQNGDLVVPAIVLPVNIPDGSPAHPGVTNVFALAIPLIPNMTVDNVTVTNLNEHQNFGDLFGAVTFGGYSVVLNNHDGYGNTYGANPIVYDDSSDPVAGSQHTDGPGNLMNYQGKSAIGPWILTEMDNSLTMTGQVSELTLVIQPHRDLKGLGVIVTIPPQGWFIDFVDVPPGYTNLTFYATNLPPTVGPPPLQMYELLGNEPTLTDYDQEADLTNCIPGTGLYPTGTDPGNSISVGPPLNLGRYFIGLYNPSLNAATVFLSATLGVSLLPATTYDYTTNPATALLDDAVSLNPALPDPGIFVSATQAIASVNVGFVVLSPRISDLTFTLVSPTGQRILLMENRGDDTTNGAGAEFVYTNILNATASGGANPNTNYLAVDPNGGTVPITYNFYTVPDEMTVYDSTNPADFDTNGAYFLWDTGMTNNVWFGPGPQDTVPVTINVPYPAGYTNITIIMNQFGNPALTNGTGDAWIYTAGAAITNFEYLMFTEDSNLATVPIKFAEPPYNFPETATNYAFDFELATNGNYRGPTNVYDAYGGWTVPSNLVTYARVLTNDQLVVVTNVVVLSNNLVSVVTDPSTSLSGDVGGSNFLALADGTITRSIPTIPGHIYNVTFWFRGPGIAAWWRGEGDASDSSDPEKNGNNGFLIGRFSFPAGEVGQAFDFDDAGAEFQYAGTNTYVQIPQNPSLDVGKGGGFTVEGWINPTNVARPQPLIEWLAAAPTNGADTNLVIEAGPFLDPATGHYYYLLGSTNWTTSELWATQLGGHLVTLDTANEDNWVYDTFAQYGGVNRNLWIGLTNNGANPPKFVWSSGLTNVTYTNWVAGGPPAICPGNSIYTAILGPTNAYPGLWVLENNNGTNNNGVTCGVPPTNRIFGVVEVTNLQPNGVQFWISVTNTPGTTNAVFVSSNGCLYADLVDVSNLTHEIYSAPGLLLTNVYQHVALTFNTNSGMARLYLNGTNVATTNLYLTNGTWKPFVPKTDGDVLLGRDMSRWTNNYYGGTMDEMSIYRRALSGAEIAAIYEVSAFATNGLTGKFDPTVTPATGLAEALVSFGGATNVIFGVNNQWEQNSFTFTATSNSMPLQITGLEPGILLDSFAVSQSPLTNIYYLPEQSLEALNGTPAYGTWTLQVWDNRVGAYVANLTDLVSWQLQFVLESNALVAASLDPQTPASSTVSPGQMVYYSVTAPTWAHYATNILVSSTLPVTLYFNPTNLPEADGTGPGDITLLTPPTTAGVSQALTVNTNPPFFPYQAGQTYYLGVSNAGVHAASVVLEVDYDILALTNGVPYTNTLTTNADSTVRYFSFDVASNATEATFQLLQLSGNADLVVRKGPPLPTLTSTDYGSFNVSNLDENIYVLTNSQPAPLSAGRWYLGVIPRDPRPINYAILAKELTNAPNIIDLTNGVPFTFSAGAGAALTNFFRFSVTNNPSLTNAAGVRFELYDLTGDGDLTLQTNAPPLAPPFFQSSQQPGLASELIYITTNSAQTNLNSIVLTNLAANWYLGVPNHEITNISFTIVAVMDTNLPFAAFPGAEGSGGGALGGRGSDVYHVVNLNDSGPGSLRYGITTFIGTGATNTPGTGTTFTTNLAGVSITNRFGARTIVFDVAGSINLLSPLVITNSYLTIAGQTAPGGGITVAGSLTTVQSAHDVVIRYVRFRPAGGIITPGVAWAGGFEGNGSSDYSPAAPAYFDGGWQVVSGDVDVLVTGDVHGGVAYEGTHYIDINGSMPGTISTNVATVAGTTYKLGFAYSRNPDNSSPDTVQLLVNSNSLLNLTVTIANSWANLGWATTSVVFTATTTNTQIKFASQTAGSRGVLLDAVVLYTNVPASTSPGDSLQLTNVANVVADHVSASWSTNNLVSVLNSSNVTVQWSIMADSLYNPPNEQGRGSVLRYGSGALSFNHNLYADNYAANPRLGDNLSLDFVNNVIYNWGIRSGYSDTNDLAADPNGYTNRLNYACNYLIAGPDTAIYSTNAGQTNFAFWGGTTNTWIFQSNNIIDSDTNGLLNGADTQWGMFSNLYTIASQPFPLPPVPTDEAFIAYEKVLDFAGASLRGRDWADADIVSSVRTQAGRIISTPPLSGLVAWWKGESNALDSVGGNNGYLTNDISFTNGEVNLAFNMGTAGYVFVPASPSLDIGPGPGFTIEGWIYPTNISASAPNPIVEWSQDNGLYAGVQFYVSSTFQNSAGCLFGGFVESNNAVAGDTFTSAPNIVTNNGFQHVALTYNHITGFGTMYLNGVQVASKKLNVNVPWTTGNVLIGRRINTVTPSQNFHFVGREDEISIFNRTLSAAEIQMIYNAGCAGKFAVPPGPLYLDTDQDGIPDFWEITFGQPPYVPSNNNASTNAPGYTTLEEYDNWLAVPHALTVTNTPVGVDLMKLFGKTGNLSFFVTNGVNGSVYLTNVLNYTNVLGAVIAVTNTGPYSNSFAFFTPANNLPPKPAFSGYASFDVYVTNTDTVAWFGPVTVSVVVSAVPVAINSNMPPVIITLTNAIGYTNSNSGGSDFYKFTVTPNALGSNAIAVLFDVLNANGPVTLVANYGLPLPSLSSYEYISPTPATAGDQHIVVSANSLPVPLTNGDWYLSVVNVSGGTVKYAARATELYTVAPPVFLYPTVATVSNVVETFSFSFAYQAADLNTPALPLTFALVSGANNPTNMTINPLTGVINWTPLKTQGPTTNGPSTNLITVSVSNGPFAVTNTLLTIIVEGTNLPPVLPVIPNQVVIVPGGTLDVTNTATNPNLPDYPMTYALLTAPPTAVIDTNGIITWTPTLAQAGTNYLFTTAVTDTNPWAVNAKSLSATNSFYVTVLTGLPPGPPQTNTVPANGINWIAVSVPTNALDATNLLLFATNLPVNVWFSTNLPPTITNAGDVDLMPNATSGVSVLTTSSMPTNIVPGGVYFLGVQNPNNVPVTYALQVNFRLALSVPVGGVVYYPVNVPLNADLATNILLFATGPLNVWFTTNSPPSITNANDVRLLPDAAYPGGTNGSVVLSAGTTPPLAPGSTYYLGLQNTNSFGVASDLEVNFHYLPPPGITNLTITATNIGGTNGFLLQWQGPANFQYEIQWTANLAPLVWHTVLNPVIVEIVTPTNGHFSFFDNGTLTGGLGPVKFYRVLGGYNLGPINGSGPVTNTVLAGTTSQAVVIVPASAIAASNFLISATGPLNVWFNQNHPPTGNPGAGDRLMLSASTAGAFVLNSNSVPPLVPGANYYLGFQNPAASDVTFVFDVTFSFAPTNTIFISGITATNIGGTNGFLLQWQGPVNYQYEIQWTTNLAPLVWHTVLNPAIVEVVTTTNGHFSFFDDGTLTGGFGAVKFYQVLGSPNLGPIPGSTLVTNTVLAGATSEAVVTVPANATSASNLLVSDTGPLNVWFNPTNPPAGNTSAGDRLMLSAASTGDFVLTGDSVPPLVPGTNYYLGFQNPGDSNVTFVFQAAFGFTPAAAPSISSITLTTNGLFQLRWTAPVNYQFQVEWTTNLMPPIVWNYIPPGPPYITSTNVIFTFVDTNAAVQLKFYRLIQQFP